jgi:hypothetical protein
MNIDAILKNLPALFAALLVAILFIQSGVDKVVDWKGNFEFLKGPFCQIGPGTDGIADAGNYYCP